MLTLLTALWLCTYITRDVPPRTYSVAYTDREWAQAEARDACERHSETCEFQGCKPWNGGTTNVVRVPTSIPQTWYPASALCWCPDQRCAYYLEQSAHGIDVWGASTGAGCTTTGHEVWKEMDLGKACERVKETLCNG